MRLIKILVGIFVLLVLAAGVLIFYAERLDWNTVKPRVEEEISQAAGRKFEIAGDLGFTLFPEPRVNATGLRLANADWGSAPLMLEAESVDFTLTLRSLVLGEPKAKRISLRGVKLLVEENQDGRDNWDFGEQTGEGGTAADIFPKLRALDAVDLSVIYRRPGADPVRVDIRQAGLGARPVGRDLAVDIQGAWNDREFSVNGSIESLYRYLGGGDLKGEILLESRDLKLRLDGNFGRPPSLAGVDFTVGGEGSEIPALGQLDRLPEDMRGIWKTDFRLAGQEQGYQISDANITLGEYRFTGSLAHDEPSGYSGNLGIAAPEYELHLEGNFGSLEGLGGVDAQVRGKGTDLPPVAALAFLPAHLRSDWEADFHVKETGQRLDVSDLKLRIGDSDLAGTASIDRSGSRPRVEGSLKSDYLDIAFLRRGERPQAVKEKASRDTDDRILNDEPIPLEWMKAADASLEIDAERLQATLFTYTDALSRVTLENGKLRISAERGTIYGADTSADLEFDAGTQPARLSMSVLARGADVGKIMSDWSEPPFMTGQGDFDIQITATGSSPAALMGSVSGEARVVVGEGTAQVGVLERMVRTVGIKTLGVLLGEETADVVPMNCFAANLTADAGVVKAEVLILDTDKATVLGSGSMDLGKETWDMLFKPKPKQVTLTTAVPIHLGGTFGDPEVSAGKVGVLRKLAGLASLFVFPPAAVAGLVDLGAGDNQCVQLAAKETKK